ncbi:30S ribosomal protein S16 [soil metagenome]
MAVKIRLKRMGKIRAPYYRVVVMDARAKRDGRAIEEIGKYHPTEEPSLIQIDSERAQHWLSVGAQPTEQVQALLKVTGDWATFTGEGDPAGTLRLKPARPDRKALYEAALAASDGAEGGSSATTRKAKKSTAKDEDTAAPAAKTASASGQVAEESSPVPAEAPTGDEAKATKA